MAESAKSKPQKLPDEIRCKQQENDYRLAIHEISVNVTIKFAKSASCVRAEHDRTDQKYRDR